jgi:succinate dehydrogenase / fumarate reductase, iron-sulfur subunit
MAETFRLRIQRRKSAEETPYWEEFELPLEPSINIIAALNKTRLNPVAAGGPTTPVSYEAACLEEVCGSCTMLVNGIPRQACSTLVEKIIAENGGNHTIELRPLTKFKTVRDLVVDRQPMFDALGRVKAWVPLDGTFAMGPGPRMSAETQGLRYALSECMTCGCCMEACPQYNEHSDFIGPAPLAQVALFNMHPTGAINKSERLQAVMAAGGATDCGNAQNCIQVCPKGVPITEAIAYVAREATAEGFKTLLKR